MLDGIAEMAGWAGQGFGTVTPRLFEGAMTGEPVFTLAQAMKLYHQQSYRCGYFSPGHELVSVVLDHALVDESRYHNQADAHRLVQEGATVVYRLLQVRLTGVADTCQVLANATGLPAFAAGYLTPAGQQGYPVHADPDSIFCIQHAGSKLWAIYPPKASSIDDPDLGWICEDPEAAAPPLAQAAYLFELSPGDVLFVPRGWGHYAVASGRDTPSLHISVGLLHPEIGSEKISEQHPVMPVAGYAGSS
jgi:hypothetical protein